tara:strand:+ start:1295 stop:2029 length:735 start_codon:yes stop_codon:yes gene_type:complete
MIVKIQNKNDFVSKFLSPISKINENAVIKIHNDKITSLATTNDETLILYVIYNEDNILSDIVNLNIPDVGRLIKVLNCIEDDCLDLELDSNKLKYSSENINFKYHLLEDGIISTPSVSFDKIKKLNFNTSFVITSRDISDIIKGSTFTVDTDKIYIYTKDGKIYGELTDRQKHNIDSFTRVISDQYTGNPITEPVPLNFEVIRLISGLRFIECTVNLDIEKRALLFTITADKYTLNFVTVGLIG